MHSTRECQFQLAKFVVAIVRTFRITRPFKQIGHFEKLASVLITEPGFSVFTAEFSSTISSTLTLETSSIGGMAEDEENRRHITRSSLKSHVSFNNYPKWKDKLRENCYKRVREDRARLLWKLRLPKSEDQRLNHKDLIKSTFQDIVSDELRKIKGSSLNNNCGDPTFDTATDDMIWEYDGLRTSCQGDCEELLLEMQRIFYEDLRIEENRKELESFVQTWEDEEDEYLARAVYDHMNLNDEQVHKEVWCPICKQGKLQQNHCLIYCSQCKLELNRSDEINLDLLQTRLAEAHTEHLDRGCRLKPEFCVETRFELTALYIKCQGCDTFEIVI